MKNFYEESAPKTELFTSVLRILPSKLRREIERIGALRRDFFHGLSEVRIRVGSPSSLVISGENLRLKTRASAQ